MAGAITCRDARAKARNLRVLSFVHPPIAGAPAGRQDENDPEGEADRVNARKPQTMIPFRLAYPGGVLTILSCCILPVLPFVFARANRPN